LQREEAVFALANGLGDRELDVLRGEAGVGRRGVEARLGLTRVEDGGELFEIGDASAEATLDVFQALVG
jgi:hypothetical protein